MGAGKSSNGGTWDGWGLGQTRGDVPCKGGSYHRVQLTGGALTRVWGGYGLSVARASETINLFLYEISHLLYVGN